MSVIRKILPAELPGRIIFVLVFLTLITCADASPVITINTPANTATYNYTPLLNVTTSTGLNNINYSLNSGENITLFNMDTDYQTGTRYDDWIDEENTESYDGSISNAAQCYDEDWDTRGYVNNGNQGNIYVEYNISNKTEGIEIKYKWYTSICSTGIVRRYQYNYYTGSYEYKGYAQNGCYSVRTKTYTKTYTNSYLTANNYTENGKIKMKFNLESIYSWYYGYGYSRIYDIGITDQTYDFSDNTTTNSTVFAEGLNTLTIYANDTYGNINQTTINFIIDTAPPEINIQTPSNLTEVGEDIWINLTTQNDAYSNTSWCGYQIDSGTTYPLTNSSGNWNAYVTDMESGTHTIYISCNDTSGNTNTTSVQLNTTSLVITPIQRTKAITNGTEDIFNISISHTAISTRNISVSCLSGDICNESLFMISIQNSTMNVSAGETAYDEINITALANLTDGTYSGFLRITDNDVGNTEDIQINYSSNLYSSDIRFNTIFINSIDMETDDTVVRTLYYNNTGTWNATHCNFSISTLSAYASFSDSDFTVETDVSGWRNTTMTITNPPAGSYAYLQVRLQCAGYLDGSIDSDVSYIDVSVTQAAVVETVSTGGSGGSSPPPVVINNTQVVEKKAYEIAVYKQGSRYIANLPIQINDCIPPTYEKDYMFTVENRDEEAFVPKFSVTDELVGIVTVINDGEPIKPYSSRDYVLRITTNNVPEGTLIQGAAYVTAGSTTEQMDLKWTVSYSCVNGIDFESAIEFIKAKFFTEVGSIGSFSIAWGYIMTGLVLLALTYEENNTKSRRIALLAVYMIMICII